MKSVSVGTNRLSIDSRSPTPVFPPKNEMTKDEVMAEFDAMCTAISADFAKSLTTAKE
jgi:hypothetical protein